MLSPTVLVLVAGAAALLLLRFIYCGRVSRPRRVTVLVLGDIGRSPRMQYHAQSLSRAGFHVDLVGLAGAAPHPDTLNDPRITLHALAPFAPEAVPGLRALAASRALPARALLLAAKAAAQFALLFYTLLLGVPRPRLVLVQSPPAIPVVLVARLTSWLVGARLVIDWHNLGYSILALGPLGRRAPALVALARRVELLGGRLADGHLAVTAALAGFLVEQRVVDKLSRVAVVHDQPARVFTELAPAAGAVQRKHELFLALERENTLEGLDRDWYNALVPSASSSSSADSKSAGNAGDGEYDEVTMVSRRHARTGAVTLRPDRPAVVVSGTSWTEDEDFDILLNAAVALDAAIAASRSGNSDSSNDNSGAALPDVLIVVTGRGPRKAHFVAAFAAARLRHVRFTTVWLRAADYPRLLRAADVGVSLHYSSSGLDLPMKVVDMFGVTLPVCAVGFACLAELVQHGRNGLVFADDKELAAQLRTLLTGFPSNSNGDGDGDDAESEGGNGSGNGSGSKSGDASGSSAIAGATLKSMRAVLRRRVDECQWQANWEKCAVPALLTEGGAGEGKAEAGK